MPTPVIIKQLAGVMKRENQMVEKWIDITGFENKYQMSTLLRVRSLDRKVRTGNNSFRIIEGRDIPINKYPNEYLYVKLYDKQKLSCKLLHRLIAEMFIPNPENKPEVNHINGIKDDNRIENLEWVTHSENMIHAYENGLSKTGYENSKSIPVIAIDRSTNEVLEFSGQRQAAKILNIDQGNIQRALKQSSATVKNYYFKYK